MQFSDLTKMAQDIWSFAWPPLAICSIAYFVAYYFHQLATKNVLRKTFIRMKEYSMKLEDARIILEPYGLTKLVPAISVVMVLSCMFLLNGPISSLVDNIPPHIYYQPDILITKHMQENQQLVLIRKYPMAYNVVEAYYMAFESSKVDSKNETNDGRAIIWYQIHLLIKFALVFAVIMFFVSLNAGLPIGRQVAKFFLLLTLISLLWIISFTYLLYEQEQDIRIEWQPVILSLQKESSSLLESPITNEEKKKLSSAWIEQNQRWWQIELLDTNRLKWIQRTFYSYNPPNQHRKK